MNRKPSPIVRREHGSDSQAANPVKSISGEVLDLTTESMPEPLVVDGLVKVQDAARFVGCEPSYLLHHKERFGITERRGRAFYMTETAFEDLKKRFPPPPDLSQAIPRAQTLARFERRYRDSLPKEVRQYSIHTHQRAYDKVALVEASLRRSRTPDPQLITVLSDLLGLSYTTLYSVAKDRDYIIHGPKRAFRLSPSDTMTLALEYGMQPELKEHALEKPALILGLLLFHRAFKRSRAVGRFWKQELRRLRPIASGETHYTDTELIKLLGFKSNRGLAVPFRRWGVQREYRHRFFPKQPIDAVCLKREELKTHPDPLEIGGLAENLGVRRRLIWHSFYNGTLAGRRDSRGRVKLSPFSVARFVRSVDSGEQELSGRSDDSPRLGKVLDNIRFNHPPRGMARLEHFLGVYAAALQLPGAAARTIEVSREYEMRLRWLSAEISLAAVSTALINLRRSLDSRQQRRVELKQSHPQKITQLQILLLEGFLN